VEEGRSLGAGVIEPHYTTQELADLLSVNPATIRRAAASGELRSVRVGRVRRYALSAVETWLSSCPERRAA
jgi:excisionase family DNA binding protein